MTVQNYKHVYDEVLAGYQSLVLPSAQEEEGKAQATRETAWRVHQQNPNIGLLAKTSGNNVNGRSVDILMDRTDGSSADAGTALQNTPQQGQVTIASAWTAYAPTSDPAWLERWIAPTAAIAAEAGPLVLKGEQPAPGPDPNPPQPLEPMPPMPTEWSPAEWLSLQWYSEAGNALDAVYCNVLTAEGATELRHADPGGWGNWWFHIVEEKWSVPQVVEAMMREPEYIAGHPNG